MKIRLFLACLFLISVALIIGSQSTAFTGFPKGYDFFDHASVVKIARDNFPHIFWNPYWDFGTVLSPRNYPPLYHFLLAGLSGALSHLSGLPSHPPGEIGSHLEGELGIASILSLMVWMAALNIAMTTLAIFGIIYLLAKKLLPALIGALFYLSSSAIWSHLLIYGLYARVFAQMTLALAVLALVFWFQRITTFCHCDPPNGGEAISEVATVRRVRRGGPRDDKEGNVERGPQDGKQAGEDGWPYYLVIFAFTAVFLSHFLATVFLVLTFFIFLFFLFPKRRDCLGLTFKIFLPVGGLSAFFYFPLFFWEFQKGNFLGVFTSKAEVPLSMGELFQQASSGLPFLSLPLFFFLALVVWLTRKGESGEIREFREIREKVFWGTGLLVLPLLFYVLGFWGRYFAGISPLQFLIAVVFFLSIFCGLGLSLLSSFKISSQRTLMVVTIGFLALSLSQIPHLKKGVTDQSRLWSEVGFKSIDTERLFRFAHRNEVLGGAFNFYSPTLQSRGYWAPGVLFPDFNLWFEEAVFGKNDNLSETTFLLDWYAIKGLYTGRLVKDGKNFSLEPKMSQNPEFFAKVGDYEWIYKNASPLLLATNAPVVLVEAGDEEYRKILAGLAKVEAGSGTIIPLRVGKKDRNQGGATSVEDFKEVAPLEGKELPRVTSWEEMKETLHPSGEIDSHLTGDEGKQKATFVHSQRREIELEGKFRGVLLKESYFRNWGAWLEKTEDGRRKTEGLKIYQAGPGMMYSFLPENYSLPAKIVFEYRQSLIEKFGFLISFVTLLLIIFSRVGMDWRKGILGRLGRLGK